MSFLKFFILISFFCFFSIVSSAQGDDKIEKAKKLISSNKNLPKALALLEDAKKDDYGFCGNAWSSAFAEIHFHTARIYLLQNLPLKAIGECNSISGYGFFGNTEKYDSLKIESLLQYYGREKLLKDLRETCDTVISTSEIEYKNVTIDLNELGIKLCFHTCNYFRIRMRKRIVGDIELSVILKEIKLHPIFEEM